LLAVITGETRRMVAMVGSAAAAGDTAIPIPARAVANTASAANILFILGFLFS
jgi:hypothetical protein